jgi:thioredoxin reductase
MNAVDLLIVGAGPAGIGAALEARRRGLQPLVLDPHPPGGLVRAARRLDNLPGLPGGITGPALAERLAAQLVEHGVEVATESVTAVERVGELWLCRAATGRDRSARAVLIATGTRPVDFDPPGWANAATTDRACRDIRALPLELAGQAVTVIGGGETALDTALSAHDRGARVTLVLRGDQLRGQAFLRDEFARTGIGVWSHHELRAIETAPDGLRLAWNTPAGPRTSQTRHLVVSIGRRAADELLQPWNTPGVFTAGDLRRGRCGYVVDAFADGRRAAERIARSLGERMDSPCN